VVDAAYDMAFRNEQLTHYINHMRDHPAYSTREAYDAWVVRYAPNAQRTSRDARERALARGHFIKSDLISGLFPKRECHRSFDGLMGLKDPRGVVTMKPEMHAVLGPMVFASQRQFVRSLANIPVVDRSVVTGEMSAENFGAWVGAWVERLTQGDRRAIIIHGDGSRFDCHMREPHLRHNRVRSFGPGRWSALEGVAVRHLEHGLRGRSRHGVAFRTGPVMASGDDRTALFDTLTNIACQTAGIQRTPGDGWALAAQGDDMFAIVAPDVWDAVGTIDVLKARVQLFGFTYSYHASSDIWDHDFCSRVVYPTADGLVAGPCLGRALSKLGYHLDWSNDGNQTLRSATIGQLQDSNHVPFLREVLRRQLALCTGPLGGQPKPGMHAAQRHEPTDATWDTLNARYGLTQQDLADLVNRLQAIQRLPAVIDWARAEELAQRDA